jgi:hypothetical protein
MPLSGRFQIWSLLDIMRKFDAWGIAMLLHHVDDLKGYSWKQCDSGNRDVSVSKQELDLHVFPTIHMAMYHAEKFHLRSTYDRVWTNGPFTLSAKIGITYQQCVNELKLNLKNKESSSLYLSVGRKFGMSSHRAKKIRTRRSIAMP